MDLIFIKITQLSHFIPNTFTSSGYLKLLINIIFFIRYALPFEKLQDKVGWTLAFQNYWHHTITLSIIYYAVIKAIQKVMENRKPFDLKTALYLWNGLLAIFSICGFIRFSEVLLTILKKILIIRIY